MIRNGERYLITSDNWFVAPDGQEYRAAYGICHVKTINQLFDIIPIRPSTNWFVIIGEGENEVVIAGCQIHFAVRCDKPPYKIGDTYDLPGQASHGTTRNKIFFTEIVNIEDDKS